MSNMDEKIRELLGEMAEEVPPRHSVPPSVVRRARQRIVLNTIAIGTLVVALGVGVFTGVHALTTTRSGFVSHGGSASSSSAPVPTAIPRCTAGHLRAVGALSGAAGSREGGIEISNYSDTACTLTGTPVVKLFDGIGKQITSGVSFGTSAPAWMADAQPEPPGWPVVTLGGMGTSGRGAYVRIRWSNWCPQGRGAPLWRIAIPGSGTVDVINGMDQINPPPCNGPGMPSTIEVGPFEPRPAA